MKVYVIANRGSLDRLAQSVRLVIMAMIAPYSVIVILLVVGTVIARRMGCLVIVISHLAGTSALRVTTLKLKLATMGILWTRLGGVAITVVWMIVKRKMHCVTRVVTASV